MLRAQIAPMLVAGFALIAMADEPKAGPYTLDESKGKARVLLIFAPSGSDMRYRSQMMWVQQATDGLKDRDMTVVEVFEEKRSRTGDRPVSADEAKAMREKFKVEKGQFLVVLVGKDGSEKFRDDAVLRMETVFHKIDEMPMRKEEMKGK